MTFLGRILSAIVCATLGASASGASASAQQSAGQPQAPSAPSPSADEIIARNVQARGGEQALTAINTIRILRHVVQKSSESGASPHEYDLLFEMKRPNLARSEVRMAQGTYEIEVYNGSSGWKTIAGKPAVEVLTANEIQAQPTFSDAVEGEAFHYRDKGYAVTLRGLTQSQGKRCYGVLVQKPSGMAYRCFDATTFLDVERRNESSTTLLSDFREVNGVMFAYRLETSSKDGTWVYTTKSIEVNVPIPAADFQQPAPLQVANVAVRQESSPKSQKTGSTLALALLSSPKSQMVASSAAPDGAPTGEQVAEARRQITEALAHVRSCVQANIFAPACSFTAPPTQLKITHDRIEFWAPFHSGAKMAYIDLKNIPELKSVPVRPFLQPATTFYAYFMSADKKYEKDSSNVLFWHRGVDPLQWSESEAAYMGEFVRALEVLKANARSPVDAEVHDEQEFKQRAAQWRELAEKPALPDAVHREEVLAKYEVTEEKNPELALAHFEKGLAIEPLWPAGQLAAATICSELQKWGCAVTHGQEYLEMMPNGPQSDVLRDKLIIWQDKLGRQ